MFVSETLGTTRFWAKGVQKHGPEALGELAGEAGVRLPETDQTDQAEGRREKKRRPRPPE